MMAEYIERESAERILESVGAPAYAIRALTLVKTTDVAPVVHGRWEAVLEGVWNLPTPVCIGWRCSECGREEQHKEPYCNCGAHMKDGDGK